MCRRAALALACALLPLAAAAARPKTSKLWGEAGELWQPDGPLMDWSFAGYKFGAVPLPSPPVTKQLADFQKPGVTDSQAIADMVAWANSQPPDAGWVVLGLPAGELTLNQTVTLTRAQTVLRGAGVSATTLRLPSSLTDLQGPSPPELEESWQGGLLGYYVWHGALVTVEGQPWVEELLAVVDASTPVPRNSRTLKVDSANDLAVGNVASLAYSPGGRALGEEIMNYELDPGNETAVLNYTVVFSSRIIAINGTEVTLERGVPWTVRDEFDPVFIKRTSTAHDIGIEGMTMEFDWTKYLGHHKELGATPLEFNYAQDCWARDLRLVNTDNGVLVAQSDRITLRDIAIGVTKPREGPPDGATQTSFDGHWGIRAASGTDVLASRIAVSAQQVHSVGNDDHGMLSVFENCTLGGSTGVGTLEMHRALCSQTLFTSIAFANPIKALMCGGPVVNGPNSGAWTTFWNLHSDEGPLPPPDNNDQRGRANATEQCSWGPALAFVGVDFSGDICPSWTHQAGVVTPANLHASQLERRLGQAAPAPAE